MVPALSCTDRGVGLGSGVAGGVMAWLHTLVLAGGETPYWSRPNAQLLSDLRSAPSGLTTADGQRSSQPSGTSAWMHVPPPGRAVRSRRPPISSARSRIERSPTPAATAGAIPHPSSSTVRHSQGRDGAREPDHARPRPGVVDDVGHRLQGNAVERRLDRRRQRRERLGGVQLDPQRGAGGPRHLQAHRLHQPVLVEGRRAQRLYQIQLAVPHCRCRYRSS